MLHGGAKRADARGLPQRCDPQGLQVQQRQTRATASRQVSQTSNK